MDTAVKFTEVRSVKGFYANVAMLAYVGIGVKEHYCSYRPSELATLMLKVSGVFQGKVKVTKLSNSGWYSFRQSGKMTYLRGDTLMQVSGNTIKLSDFYDLNT